MARLEVSVERVIRAPRDRVSAYAADPSNAPLWYANISSVEWQGEPGTHVGASAAFVAHFMGRRMAYVYRISEHVPGECLVMRTESGPFEMMTRYEWSDARRGTRMRLINAGNPDGFMGLMAPLMRLAMSRAMTKDLAALAKIMQSGRS